MRRSKKQRRERIYEVRNSEEETAQNKQCIAKHTITVTANKIKWRWQWTKRMTKTETTTMITATITTAAATANWIKKFLCLNRISKEIRIKIEIKSIYDEATCLLNTHFIKKKINRQKAATDEFRLQSVYNRFFVVQQTHKTYSVICTHDSFIFTQQSHSDRTVCSALKTVYTVFFDLIFFFCVYWERSFFFFFSIDFKEITICNISMNLIKQWKSSSNDRTDMTVMTKKKV